jgi:uncharacterized membrane protein YgcG
LEQYRKHYSMLVAAKALSGWVSLAAQLYSLGIAARSILAHVPEGQVQVAATDSTTAMQEDITFMATLLRHCVQELLLPLTTRPILPAAGGSGSGLSWGSPAWLLERLARVSTLVPDVQLVRDINRHDAAAAAVLWSWRGNVLTLATQNSGAAGIQPATDASLAAVDVQVASSGSSPSGSDSSASTTGSGNSSSGGSGSSSGEGSETAPALGVYAVLAVPPAPLAKSARTLNRDGMQCLACVLAWQAGLDPDCAVSVDHYSLSSRLTQPRPRREGPWAVQWQQQQQVKHALDNLPDDKPSGCLAATDPSAAFSSDDAAHAHGDSALPLLRGIISSPWPAAAPRSTPLPAALWQLLLVVKPSLGAVLHFASLPPACFTDQGLLAVLKAPSAQSARKQQQRQEQRQEQLPAPPSTAAAAPGPTEGCSCSHCGSVSSISYQRPQPEGAAQPSTTGCVCTAPQCVALELQELAQAGPPVVLGDMQMAHICMLLRCSILRESALDARSRWVGVVWAVLQTDARC